MARIKVVTEYDLVCSNCFQPIEYMMHDNHEPPQVAVAFCPHCVKGQIKSAIESERRRIHKIIQDSENA